MNPDLPSLGWHLTGIPADDTVDAWIDHMAEQSPWECVPRHEAELDEGGPPPVPVDRWELALLVSERDLLRQVLAALGVSVHTGDDGLACMHLDMAVPLDPDEADAVTAAIENVTAPEEEG